MFDTLKSKLYQKKQYIPDIKNAYINPNFKGLPCIKDNCTSCTQCQSVCPTKAINKEINNDISIDIGKCLFCGDCERICPNKAIKFNHNYKLATTLREHLIINKNTNIDKYQENAIKSSEKIRDIFGNSLKLRQVSAGGCNSCELELNACSNVNFDMGRFGIEIVASPRHADGIIITGPITENMHKALEDAYKSTPDPKIIILAGACAISGGLFENSIAVNREFIENHNIDLYIPGCPVHPLSVINGILSLLDK